MIIKYVIATLFSFAHHLHTYYEYIADSLFGNREKARFNFEE